MFEIATDPPGFTLDEPENELGSKLVLPEWLEPRREELATVLHGRGASSPPPIPESMPA